MKFLFFILKLCYLLNSINGQFHPSSPCPGIFSYEGSEPERDHWYGVILVSTDEALVGVRLDIRFDRPVQLLVSWMGEVTSTNNERFTILSLTQKLLPGPPLSSRFMVKFDSARGSPQLRSIRLNGRQICPPDPNFPINLSNRPHPPIEKTTKRPDPSFEHNYNSGHGQSESLGPVVFDHQSISTTKKYSLTENTNQYNKPTRSPQIQNNNQPEYTNNQPPYTNNVPTTRRPIYVHENTDSLGNNYNGGNYFESPNYNKPQNSYVTTETYNNQVRPNQNFNYNNNYNNNNKETNYTTKQPNNNNSNKQQNSNSENSYSNNQNNNNKSSTKPTYSYPSNSGTKTTVSNQRNTEKTPTTDRNNNKKTTSRPSSSQSNNNNYDHRVNPTKNSNSGGSFQYQVGKSTTPRNQNSDGVLGVSSSNSYECGIVDESISSLSQSAPIPLITNGQKTARGQWPWHIALYKIEGINLGYVCGGTLVTLRTVITAAHCVTKKLIDRPVDPDILVVYLGKYHLYQFSDDGGVQNKQVKDVHIYPGYNSSNFLGDIALLTLTSPVEYTSFVRPCCLWRSNSTVVGKEGTVVGWGYDENDRVAEELKMASMPVVSRETCIYSYPDFFTRFTSNQTFCAGFRKGTTVCNGDSGGGMVFNQDGRWHLRGLVSITVSREGHRICDPNHYVIFTDVAEYQNWVNRHLI